MTFVSDLDNTLFYSYKRAVDGDICIEFKKGMPLMFMPALAYELLKEVERKFLFIPLTTRSLEQYRRISLPVCPKFAVVANGALLLIDGEIDGQWKLESRELFGGELPYIRDNRFVYDVRYVDDFFVFCKSDVPEQAVRYMRDVVDSDLFYVSCVRNKIYVFPVGLDKGSALMRLRKRLNLSRTVCAGDSLLDVPMLKIADVAIFPETLNFPHPNSHPLKTSSFINDLLQKLNELPLPTAHTNTH